MRDPMTTLRTSLIRLAHQQPALRPHLLPLLTRTAGAINPSVSLWSKADRTYAIKLVTRKGETLWTGDGWKHSMDFFREDAPLLFASEADARKELVAKALPYIARWQPGYWEDFVRGWEVPSGMTPR